MCLQCLTYELTGISENKQKKPQNCGFINLGRAICTIHELILCMSCCRLGKKLSYFWMFFLKFIDKLTFLFIIQLIKQQKGIKCIFHHPNIYSLQIVYGAQSQTAQYKNICKLKKMSWMLLTYVIQVVPMVGQKPKLYIS